MLLNPLSIIMFCIALFSLNYHAFCQNMPHIEYELVLSTSMEKALKKYNSDFRIWKQADFPPFLLKRVGFSLKSSPSAVIGDFNGDNLPDAVLWGHDKRSGYLLAVMSSNSVYKVVEIERLFNLSRHDPRDETLMIDAQNTEKGLQQTIGLLPKQSVRSHIDGKMINLKNDAVVFSYFEKASQVYYWKNGEFKEYGLTD